MRPLAQRHGIQEITLLANIDIAMFQPTTENPCWPILKSFTFAFCNVLQSYEWVVTKENPLSAEEEDHQRQETRERVADLNYEVLEAWRTATKTHDVVVDRCHTNELEVAGRYANEFGPDFQ